MKHLQEHGPMTFNRLVLEMCAHTVTADVAFEEPPYVAVTKAIRDGRMMVSANAPCLLAIADERAIGRETAKRRREAESKEDD